MRADDLMKQILKEEAYFVNQRKGDLHSFVLDDDQDQLLQKLLNIQRMPQIDRENYTKNMSYCLKHLGRKGIDHLKTICESYKNDDERFQIMFLEQLNLVYKTLPKGELEGQTLLLQTLSYFLLNSILKIKEIAGRELSKIADHLEGDDKGNQLLPIIIKMAHDDANEENRIVALQLMGKLGRIFGLQLCESFIAFEVLSLGEDAKTMVRREAVTQLPLVAKIVGKDFFNKKLLPFYLKKCKEHHTKLKIACVDQFLAINELATPAQRAGELTQILLMFHQDQNKPVKGVAYRCLARFIASIEPEKLDMRLFENYLRMTESEIKELLPEQQVMFACAYGLPAVLQSLGPTKWPQLHKLFMNLWKQKNDRIQKTLAASLHEIAKMIGPTLAEKDLFPILETIYIKEPNDTLLLVCVKNLTQFLKIFSEERRESLMDIFFIIQKDRQKWRIRESLANQIEEMAKIYNANTIFSIIFPISLKMCQDNVSQVRKVAQEKIHSLINGVQDSPDREKYEECMRGGMIGFSKSQVFNQRQGFVTMCTKMMFQQPALFQEHFKVPLLELQKDKVANVRFALGKMLREHVNQKGPFENDAEVLECLYNLTQDQVVLKLLMYENQQKGRKDIQQEEMEVESSVPENKQPYLQEVDEDELPQRPQFKSAQQNQGGENEAEMEVQPRDSEEKQDTEDQSQQQEGWKVEPEYKFEQ